MGGRFCYGAASGAVVDRPTWRPGRGRNSPSLFVAMNNVVDSVRGGDRMDVNNRLETKVNVTRDRSCVRRSSDRNQTYL